MEKPLKTVVEFVRHEDDTGGGEHRLRHLLMAPSSTVMVLKW